MRNVFACLLPALCLCSIAPVNAADLSLPVNCAMNETCFVQQYPDMDASTGASDPWCGGATYDGHDGTDIRVRSLRDIAGDGVAVIASADGRVLGVRDGMADRLVNTPEDRAAIEGRECGNGVVLDNGNGLVTQYCHMRQGSIVVAEGDVVQRGDRLGLIGASGWVQFPHVHVSVREDDTKIDPTTGLALSSGCLLTGTVEQSLWDEEAREALRWEGQILDLGFTGAPIDHARLVSEGAPPALDSSSENLIAWAWFINLRQGDVIALRLSDGSGAVIAQSSLEPLDNNKATYSAFIGKQGSPMAGTYTFTIEVLRDGAVAITDTRSVTI